VFSVTFAALQVQTVSGKGNGVADVRTAFKNEDLRGAPLLSRNGDVIVFRFVVMKRQHIVKLAFHGNVLHVDVHSSLMCGQMKDKQLFSSTADSFRSLSFLTLNNDI